MICYLLMGWCIIVRGNILPELLTNLGFALLLAGGIIYSIGAVLYGLGKKRKYVHSIFSHFHFLRKFTTFLLHIIFRNIKKKVSKPSFFIYLPLLYS